MGAAAAMPHGVADHMPIARGAGGGGGDGGMPLRPTAVGVAARRSNRGPLRSKRGEAR